MLLPLLLLLLGVNKQKLPTVLITVLLFPSAGGRGRELARVFPATFFCFFFIPSPLTLKIVSTPLVPWTEATYPATSGAHQRAKKKKEKEVNTICHRTATDYGESGRISTLYRLFTVFQLCLDSPHCL